MHIFTIQFPQHTGLRLSPVKWHRSALTVAIATVVIATASTNHRTAYKSSLLGLDQSQHSLQVKPARWLVIALRHVYWCPVHSIYNNILMK